MFLIYANISIEYIVMQHDLLIDYNYTPAFIQCQTNIVDFDYRLCHAIQSFYLFFTKSSILKRLCQYIICYQSIYSFVILSYTYATKTYTKYDVFGILGEKVLHVPPGFIRGCLPGALPAEITEEVI